MKIEIYSDGSCHNDGSGSTPMGAGGHVVIEGTTVLRFCSPCGFGTSPKAEWEAFGRMAKLVDSEVLGFELKGHDIVFYSDNEMLTKQVKGIDGHSKFELQWSKYMRHFYAIKNRAKSCTIMWIPREENTIADELASKGRSGIELLGIQEEITIFAKIV